MTDWFRGACRWWWWIYQWYVCNSDNRIRCLHWSRRKWIFCLNNDWFRYLGQLFVQLQNAAHTLPLFQYIRANAFTIEIIELLLVVRTSPQRLYIKELSLKKIAYTWWWWSLELKWWLNSHSYLSFGLDSCRVLSIERKTIYKIDNRTKRMSKLYTHQLISFYIGLEKERERTCKQIFVHWKKRELEWKTNNKQKNIHIE